MNYDFIVVGGGIVGLSTAWQLQQQRPDADILLLEKEPDVAKHQTGHNSGVIHAGVYYEPGSLKARLCREGATATYQFCREHHLPCEQTGKLIVASTKTQLPGLQALFERCNENGLKPEYFTGDQLQEIEPAITGSGAFRVGESGIVDYPAICRQMLKVFLARGGTARFRTEVTAIRESASEITVSTGTEVFCSGQLIVCAGLMADRLAKRQGLKIRFRIIPFRGEYYRLSPELGQLTRHLIYPVPDPNLPFLGVHLTRMIDGSITVGPNAVQGWKREGYGKLNLSFRDTAEILSFPGFWKLSARHFAHGLHENWNSIWKRGYLAQVQKYCPQIKLSDLHPHPAGIRAQAVMPDGSMMHDFLFEETPRSLHVCNAPSPAATSAIPIARHICSRLIEKTTN
jgi:L-2-hydroxyglutarate oxidase